MGESAMSSRAREQGDQGEEQGGENRDPALMVKSQYHRSQPHPPMKNNAIVLEASRALCRMPPNRAQAASLLVE